MTTGVSLLFGFITSRESGHVYKFPTYYSVILICLNKHPSVYNIWYMERWKGRSIELCIG